MENRRDCQEVITSMLSHIPETEKDLIIDLKWHYNDSKYKAPEESLHWKRTMRTLENRIPNPDKEWEWKVLSIFTTKDIDTLKSIFQLK